VTILLIFGGIATLYLLWFAFRAAIFALPVYAGISIAFHLLDRDLGHGAAILGGLAPGIGIFVAGRLLAAFAASTLVRLPLVALFAIPAGFAGYQLASGLGGLFADPGPLISLASWTAALIAATSAATSLEGPVCEAKQSAPVAAPEIPAE
jgi:hypothetical protein